jgi:WD40 repeat protein
MSADGKRLLGSVYGPDTRKLKLWDVRTGQLLKTFDGITVAYPPLLLGPRGKLALVGGPGGLADWSAFKLLDLESGKVIRSFDRLKEHWQCPIAFSPDARSVLLHKVEVKPKNRENRVYHVLWDIKAGKETRRFPEQGTPENNVNGSHLATDWVAFCPDGKGILLVEPNNRLSLLEVASGKRTWTVTAKGRGPAFVDKGKRVVLPSVYWDINKIEWRLYWHDLSSGKIVREKKIVHSLVP